MFICNHRAFACLALQNGLTLDIVVMTNHAFCYGLIINFTLEYGPAICFEFKIKALTTNGLSILSFQRISDYYAEQYYSSSEAIPLLVTSLLGSQG